MAIPTLSGSYIDETYIRLVQVSGSEFADGLGNPISFGAGSLSGGINDYIPVWSGSTSLSNSFLNQNGGILKTTSGSINEGINLNFSESIHTFGGVKGYIRARGLGDSGAAGVDIAGYDDIQINGGGYVNIYADYTNITSNLSGMSTDVEGKVTIKAGEYPYGIKTNLILAGSDYYGNYLKTQYSGSDAGLKLDFQSNQYSLGDGSATSINVNGNTSQISIQSDEVIAGGYSQANGVWLRTTLSSIGDMFGNGNGTNITVNDTDQSIILSGSIFAPNITEHSGDKVVLYNLGDGRLYYTASSAIGGGTTTTIDTGSFATTGSNTFIGDQIITGSLQIDETLTKFAKTTINSIGTTELMTNNTGSFSAALGKYTINSGSNTRAGEFMTAWNGSEIATTDTSTTDIGITRPVSFTSSISVGQIVISVNAQSTGWNIKILTTYI